ncbi:hypothetical protein J31TS4_11400 [Paenibacillus sp. J31TS4]|uniref:hypothetical protein n=1 Tax=Paenibacillus sp. J31TS4 TaxID=2807195 RepID=UPI001B221F38|nr:hypothetical protein [Paenibacillus sp. J31TS4]GIP37860.1 hypothetical protein J31TS4_11400 [Paenibacillus sp. J31TS4]
MGVEIEQIRYGSWGDAVRMSNGTVELAASLAFGPRIMRYAACGEANVFMEDHEGRVKKGGPEYESVGGGEWRIYGGHRLWTSPEAVPRAAYPDNEPVAWRRTERGILLASPEEKWTHIRKTIEIALADQGSDVTVTHRIENRGAWPIECSAWALSVLAPGGTAIIPQTGSDTGLLPNRIVSLWPYSRMNDPRVTWGDRYITIRQGQGASPFKLGTSNEQGWAAYLLNGQLFVKRFSFAANGRYPDFGCSFECYVSDHMVELESLSELTMLAPGSAIEHVEQWSLIRHVDLEDRDETAISHRLGGLLAANI